MINVKNIFFIFLIIISVDKSFAAEIIDQNFSVKDLGRGGVHLPRESDPNSMYYNPAMLAYTSGIHWSIFGFQAGINDPSNLTLIQNSPPSQSTLSQYYGKNIWAGAQAGTTMILPNFGVGGLGSFYLDFMASNPSLPQVDVTEFVDYGIYLGTAFSISKDWAFGVNFKKVTRTGGTATIGSSQIASLNMSAIQNAVSNSGSGYGGDFGIIYKPQSAVNLAISLNWQDVGYTSFNAATGATAPPPMQDNMVLGVTTQQHAMGFGWAAGFEYRHIRNDPIDITKKLHAGVELNMGILDVRSGFYQGWLSYGATIDLWLFDLDLAQYTIERGAYAGQNGELRYQVGLNFEAGFDPQFNFTSMGGKSHKLKLRR
jgi:hypothetical protein